MKKNKGITLIALVVTIIVLIILAAVSINLVVGDNGIVTNAELAAFKTDLCDVREQVGYKQSAYKLDEKDPNSIFKRKYNIDSNTEDSLVIAIAQERKEAGMTDYQDIDLTDVSALRNFIENGDIYYIEKEQASGKENTYLYDTKTNTVLRIAALNISGVNYHYGEVGNLAPQKEVLVGKQETLDNWQYSLDDTNNIITLKQYIGSEEDVYVYAKYKLNNKTYTTKLSCYRLFSNCNNVKTIVFDPSINTSNVTDMRDMFVFCSSLTSLDLSGFNTSKVTTMYEMFRSCSSLTSLNLSNFNTSNVTNMDNMFYGCSSLTSLNVNSFNTSNVTNMNAMFYGCSSLTSLNLSSFDTSNVTNMGYMFYYCKSLTSLDLSSFNTSNVEYMRCMFYECLSLTSLDVSGFNTSNITDMYGMFYACKSLTSLNLSSFNTGNVTDMRDMFEYCSSLTSLDLSSFNTSNVEYMKCMFYECSSLRSLNLSSFNTSSVKNVEGMFYYCRLLTSLDLCSFDTSNVTDMGYMFYYCKSLKTINVTTGKWVINSGTNTSYMFDSCGTNSVTYNN